ncbi:hypothetical protein, partial [Paenibacillus sp. FSL M7-0831]|uniref:hypothetical protein n=1 Tax=Paenibacillus sp. FSL M7-0831 TaxID=2975314 RepID=UPI0030F7A865
QPGMFFPISSTLCTYFATNGPERITSPRDEENSFINCPYFSQMAGYRQLTAFYVLTFQTKGSASTISHLGYYSSTSPFHNFN